MTVITSRCDVVYRLTPNGDREWCCEKWISGGHHVANRIESGDPYSQWSDRYSPRRAPETRRRRRLDLQARRGEEYLLPRLAPAQRRGAAAPVFLDQCHEPTHAPRGDGGAGGPLAARPSGSRRLALGLRCPAARTRRLSRLGRFLQRGAPPLLP